jgi:hypothetical protein
MRLSEALDYVLCISNFLAFVQVKAVGSLRYTYQLFRVRLGHHFAVQEDYLEAKREVA